MDSVDLQQFLLYCGREGYATLGDDGMVKEADGSTSITLTQGDWRFHDSYFGGEPYGGREVVFYHDKPVWMMVYYGQVDDAVTDLSPMYGFLRQALAAVPDEAPYRGPKEFVGGELAYHNRWTGTLESFHGHETITRNSQEIYTASYIGGLINKR